MLCLAGRQELKITEAGTGAVALGQKYTVYGELCLYTVYGKLCLYTVYGKLCLYTVYGKLCLYRVYGKLCLYTVHGKLCLSSNESTFVRFWIITRVTT